MIKSWDRRLDEQVNLEVTDQLATIQQEFMDHESSFLEDEVREAVGTIREQLTTTNVSIDGSISINWPE